MKKVSKSVSRTLNYMQSERGKIPARIIFALSSLPLKLRTFGNIKTGGGELNDSHFDKFFSGSYLITMVTAGVVNKLLHAEGTIQTLYSDSSIFNYFKSRGLDTCGLWDFIDTKTLDENLSAENHDTRWAYSACKPFAIKNELELAKKSARQIPILFHDTDLVLRKPYDKILGLSSAEELAVAFGHAEEIGTDFYPPLEKLQLSSKFKLLDNKNLLHIPSGRIYRADLKAVNTCLMFFSDYEVAAEFAEIFRDFMMNNFLEDYNWLKGEHCLLAADQRTCLMVTERRGLKFLKDVRPFLPISWAGNRFVDIATLSEIKTEWHYYRPDYADPSEEPRAKIFTQEIQHLWNNKNDLELHCAYSNFLGMFDLELIRAICPLVNISWSRLEKSLRKFPVLKNYFKLLDMELTIEELLEREKLKPAEQRIIDNKLIKNLPAPLIPEELKNF